MLQRCLSGMFFLVMVITSATFAEGMPSIDSILQKMQDNVNISTDARARVTLTQQKPSQGVKNFEMMYYRRDKDNAFLIVFSAPEAEKGNGYLRIGDNFWMYRRNTRTFQHINRDESIGGPMLTARTLRRANSPSCTRPQKIRQGKR